MLNAPISMEIKYDAVDPPCNFGKIVKLYKTQRSRTRPYSVCGRRLLGDSTRTGEETRVVCPREETKIFCAGLGRNFCLV